MSCSDTFDTVAHACKVPPVNAKGKPLAKPRASKEMTRGLAYTLDEIAIFLPVFQTLLGDSNR